MLVGRPYNLYDRSINCDIPRKLRALYGVNVLPMDFLPLDDEDITDVNPNMYWNSGRRILAAARITRRHPNLHVVYISNFKCGPDSYIKSFMDDAAGKPRWCSSSTGTPTTPASSPAAKPISTAKDSCDAPPPPPS